MFIVGVNQQEFLMPNWQCMVDTAACKAKVGFIFHTFLHDVLLIIMVRVGIGLLLFYALSFLPLVLSMFVLKVYFPCFFHYWVFVHKEKESFTYGYTENYY